MCLVLGAKFLVPKVDRTGSGRTFFPVVIILSTKNIPKSAFVIPKSSKGGMDEGPSKREPSVRQPQHEGEVFLTSSWS